MIKLIIGCNATGKSHYIANNNEFLNYIKLDIYEYQQQVRNEYTDKEYISGRENYKILYEANERIIKDILKAVDAGKDIVVEHTLFKRKRRLHMIEAIREISDTPIEVYVMMPSDERLKENCKLKKTEDTKFFEYVKNQMEELELPSVSEGVTKTFVIKDSVIEEYVTETDEKLLLKARRENEDEVKQLQEEQKYKVIFEKAVKETKYKPFWHICENCGKKELLTSKEAFDKGWDYPGTDGIYKERKNYGFGSLAPRICGDCTITHSVFWKMMEGESLSETDKEVIKRIKNEPVNLLNLKGCC